MIYVNHVYLRRDGPRKDATFAMVKLRFSGRLRSTFSTASPSPVSLALFVKSRAQSDVALETGMADGGAVGHDRLDEILASAASRK
jgi:hypothetical protein